MKMLDILQSDDFNILCGEAVFDDDTCTIEETRDAFNGKTLLLSELFEMLSDEQKTKAESYLYANDQYERVMASREFRRGFRLAVKLMAESMS